MRYQQEQVKQLMNITEQSTPSLPMVPNKAVQELRLKLHEEEAVIELRQAFVEGNIVKVADAIGDALVVVLGTAAACGIDIQPVFDEIIMSNHSKFIGGVLKRPDGKWLKGPHYFEPNLVDILVNQTPI